VKIHIYYFSGTGNTAWVVRRLAERLAELGDEVTFASCEDVSALVVDPAACDMMGIAFPCRSSFAPPVFRDFLRGLPSTPGMPLFAITTSGYWAGDAAWYSVRPLQVKGYEPFLLSDVVMGNNLHLPVLCPLPVVPPKEMARRLERAGHKADRLADLIHRREPYVEGGNPFGRLLGITQRWGSERFEGRFFKGFSADETCTRCGWCVRHCPVDNIEMMDTCVEFQGNCILCMRCYSFCPVQAIQAGEGTRNVEKYRRYQGPEGKPYPSGHTVTTRR